jgi:putative ABC transport system ATP-binding protein
LVPALTVAQNVALPRLFARRRAPKRDVYAALSQVAIRDKASATPDAISGGQQQRAAVARALFIGPKAVFADEPTGALDVRSAGAVLNQFSTLVKAGACVVMVTHDPAVAARADRVLFLVDGRFHSELQGASVDRIAAQAASWELARAGS